MKGDTTRDGLEQLYAQGSLRDIDYFLARALERRGGERDPLVLVTAAVASRVVAEGHICLDLEAVAGTSWPPAVSVEDDPMPSQKAGVSLPPLDAWLAALERSPVCGVPSEEECPLVLVQGERPRLYLRRYYLYEQRIAERLKALAEPLPGCADPGTVDAMLARLFPAADDGSHAGPREAAGAALARRLLIISGGPGTGKTYTLARLLVLLVESGIDQGRELVVRMAAPTGKAAMRMRESIRSARDELELADALARKIPEDACTLHRLLGARPNSPHFRYNVDNPLPADVVIVDEASMIDLPLMAKLLDALQPDARLILLGDMHQLSSVEPGYVLGDICDAALAGDDAPLAGSLVELTHSRRFPPDGPVGRLGTALRGAGGADDADGAAAWETLQGLQGAAAEGGDAVTWRDSPAELRDAAGRPIRDLRQLILRQYRAFLEATGVVQAFEALAEFRILCALRRGHHGVETLNTIVEEVLSLRNMKLGPGDPDCPARRLIPTARFYDHRVIMVTRNNYGLRLFNGDVGIVLPADADGKATGDDAEGRLVAWFEVTDEETGRKDARALPCHMLPEHETAFAMTIHKAQGSQFRNILVMVPPRENPLLTKELLYTGITRAEKHVWLWCGEPAFRRAATHRTSRASGLKEALCRRPK